MAIFTVGASGLQVGTTGATVSGLDITEATVEEAVGSVVRAKDGNGDVKAVLLAKAKRTMTASGYSSGTAPIALRTSVTGPGFTGQVIETSMDASAEDFTKFSITAAQVA